MVDTMKKKQKIDSKTEKSLEILFGEQKYDEIIELALKDLKSNPLSLHGLTILGLAFFQSGRFREAISTFDQACSLEPTSAVHCYHLGLCYLELMELKPAVMAFKKSLQLDPLLQKPYFALAGIYNHQGLKDDAGRLLKEILIIDPFSKVANSAREALST
jgi:tetratricopeptide (TPR) repeat protein